MKNRFRVRMGRVFLVIMAGLLLGVAVNQVCLVLEDKGDYVEYGQIIDVDGKGICINVEGEGEKKMVLLSGWGTASPVLDYKPLTEKLKSEYTIAVVEGLGYGLSDDTKESRTVENITEELHAVVSQLGFESYVLMGHSISGIYMLSYVNQYEDEVEAVIGLDPSVPEQLEKESQKLSVLQNGGNLLVRFMSRTGVLRLLSWIAPNVIVPPYYDKDSLTPEEQEDYRLISLHRMINQTMMDEFRQMKPSCERMGDMKYPKEMPVLYFLASDNVDSMDWWYEIHENQLEGLKKKKIVVLEGGHYLHYTQSQAIATQTTSFLESK